MSHQFFFLFVLTSLLSSFSFAQIPSAAFSADEDLAIGNDIFQDFNEDLEAAQVMEDERFYRYSRFFGVNIGLGITTFTDNRGLAYEDNSPSFSLSLLYFMNFQNAVVIGIEHSQHIMLIDTFVNGSPDQIIGAVETSMLRPFIGFRYYIDTNDLGTAITYSTPYFVGRMEYWYQTNSFIERKNLSGQVEGGLGTGVGFGFEFPIEIKKTYINIEFLYHRVNFFDKFTRDYAQIENPKETDSDGNILESTYGYDDLRGDVLSMMINYHISW